MTVESRGSRSPSVTLCFDGDVAVFASDETRAKADRQIGEIGLGAGFVAGEDCDIAIETQGPDPGAIIRAGRVPSRRQGKFDGDLADQHEVRAPSSGLFQTTKIIGAFVEGGDALGAVGESIVHAPVSGRIRGLVRRGQAVAAASVIAEIATSNATRVAGVSDRDQLISRGVAFAVEMEVGGWVAASFEDWR